MADGLIDPRCTTLTRAATSRLGGGSDDTRLSGRPAFAATWTSAALSSPEAPSLSWPGRPGGGATTVLGLFSLTGGAPGGGDVMVLGLLPRGSMPPGGGGTPVSLLAAAFAISMPRALKLVARPMFTFTGLQ